MLIAFSAKQSTLPPALPSPADIGPRAFPAIPNKSHASSRFGWAREGGRERGREREERGREREREGKREREGGRERDPGYELLENKIASRERDSVIRNYSRTVWQIEGDPRKVCRPRFLTIMVPKRYQNR